MKKFVKLNTFLSTAICGNDILSSTLYTAAIAAIFAGMYAPFVLLSIALILFLYRSVYREVVEAMPFNGGAYNALLNSTSKIAAAITGTMTVLSYLATAVISAKTAVAYLLYLGENSLTVQGIALSATTTSQLTIIGTIIILVFFAILVIMGITNSAKVAAAIFSFHIFTLTFIIISGIIYLFKVGGLDVSALNWLATDNLIANNHGLLKTLFLGFSVSLLGISGFESSADFVEEQQEGVFPKTLRNMTIAVMIFNPLIAAVALYILPLTDIIAAKDFLLNAVGNRVGGLALIILISIDAFLVLSGAVLTAYVSVSNLIKNMARDNVLPQFLINHKKSNTRPVLIFLVLSISILLLTKGNILSLAGVYTISFLGVMTLFAISNLILRKNRPELHRPYRASLITVVFAAVATTIGLVGNIIADTDNIIYFSIYFIPAIFIIILIIFKKDLYASLKKLFRLIKLKSLSNYFHRQELAETNSEFYIFIHHPDEIFSAMRYVHHNENCNNITLVHCQSKEIAAKNLIEQIIPILKTAGVYSHLRVKFIYLNQEFNPQTVKNFIRTQKVPINKIFMGAVPDRYDFSYKDFGGARIILR